MNLPKETALAEYKILMTYTFEKLKKPASIGAIACAAALFISPDAAQAAKFNFSYGEGTSYNTMLGFQRAGNIWSAYLKDDVTINIYVETTNSLPNNVIGGSLPGIKDKEKYSDLLKNLGEDQTSVFDGLVYRSLTENFEKEFNISFNGNGNAEIDGVKKLNLSRANTKAIGLEKGDKEDLDAVILMSSLGGTGYNWFYGLDGEMAETQLDFTTVALHEIGHALGFFSGLDDPGLISMVLKKQLEQKEIKEGDMKYNSFLDLFRYSASSALTGSPDMSLTEEDAYFSIDRGQTKLADFSAGVSVDGFQASHWQDGETPLGIMGPLLRPGAREQITALDLQAFDVLGWDIDYGAVLDLALVDQQAKANLAADLSSILDTPITVEWLEQNSDLVADLLSTDRSKDVEKLIKETERYDRRSSSRSGYWQETWRDVFAQQAYFSSLSPAVSTATSSEAKSVPEPMATLGLLGVGALGLGSKLLKRKSQ